MKNHRYIDNYSTHETDNSKNIDLNNSYARNIAIYPLITIVFYAPYIIFITSTGVAKGSIIFDFLSCSTIIAILSFKIYLYIKDRACLKAAGLIAPSWGWFPLSFVYLFRRQYVNKLSYKFFWAHILILFILFFFAALGSR